MSSKNKEILYFPDKGAGNTDEVLRAALKRAEELDIKTVIVASTYGDTGVKASELFKGYNVVSGHSCYRL